MLIKPSLSLVYPYYRNPAMLVEQFRVWSTYPEDLKAQIEVIVVDDGSPAPDDAPYIGRPDGLPAFRLYRVLEDVPWHQHGARNLGAKEAAADWLFLADMDHVLPAESLRALLQRLNYDVVYIFPRVDAPDMQPRLKKGEPHHHPNIFALTKARYWFVGGYDEDLTGYGTDSFFKARLLGDRQAAVAWDAPIVRVPREVIPDASTTTLPRKEGRPAGAKAQNRAIHLDKIRRGVPPTTLNFKFERVL